MDYLYITQNALNKHHISLGEFIALLNYNEDYDFKKNTDSLRNKDLAFITDQGKILLTNKGIRTFTDIILDSKKDAPDKQIEELAEALKKVFPKGKKPGTLQYWAEGKALIIKRLRIFYKKYGVYDNNTIIDAAKRYVQSFNGDYSYMRTLKYFIFKDIKGVEGVEYSSDLVNFIENKDEDENENLDWYNNIV